MNTRTIGVWLILRGDSLIPRTITDLLKIQPSKQHIKGHPKQKSPNIIAKTGLWSLESDTISLQVSDHIDSILKKLDEVNQDIRCIEGVDEAFIDVFFAERDENDNSSPVSFFLTLSQIKKMSQLGLGLAFSN